MTQYNFLFGKATHVIFTDNRHDRLLRQKYFWDNQSLTHTAAGHQPISE